VSTGSNEHDDAPLARPARLLEYLHETLTVLNASFEIIYSSEDHRGVLGYEPGTWMHTNPLSSVHPDDVPQVNDALASLLAEPGASLTGEFRLKAADGSWQWVEGVAHNLLDDPEVRGIVMSTRNITHRVEALERAHTSEQRLAALVDHADVVVTIIRTDGRFLYASAPATRVLGYEPHELVSTHSLTELVHPEGRDTLADVITRCARNPGSLHRLNTRVVQRDSGTMCEVDMTLTNLFDEPNVNGIVVNIQDVSERVQLVDALRHQALHDPLTGLPNRALLLDRIEVSLARARRTHTPTALCFLDLDRFKVANDSLGHAAGDRILVEVAARLRSVVRDTDTVARLGGDEFVVLADDLPSQESATALAQRLLGAVEQPVVLPQVTITPTVSIGVVVSDGHALPADLVRDADAAMYQAKDDGRARLRVFDETIAKRAHARMRDETELRHAIEHSDLSLDYQPIVALVEGVEPGYEALLRWNHPERGRLPAAQFIDVAEDAGLLTALTGQILDQACRDAARWHRGARTWVNLAPVQLGDERLESLLCDAMHAAGIGPESIGVEVTEGAIIGETSSVARGIETIAQLGIPIGLDDFGTGYSSLSHLHRFPVAVVKIDKSFVEPIDRRSDEIISAIVAMAHALGLTVIAEGVETEEAFVRVVELGCDAAQGFLLGRPAPVEMLHANAKQPRAARA